MSMAAPLAIGPCCEYARGPQQWIFRLKLDDGAFLCVRRQARICFLCHAKAHEAGYPPAL